MQLNFSKYFVSYQNGALRWIKSGDIEIIRMIYAAVRDHNWGTIEPEVVNEKIQQTATGFKIKVSLKYKKDNIDFEAEYLISGTGHELIFEMYGEAKSTFRTNRVGFCVLHPIKACAGKICTLNHPDGTVEKAVFPELISPIQPMFNISEMEWSPAPGISAKLRFLGDVFEMEDQRNWTDASYKTYCRPLGLPFPFEIKNGEKIHQKIILEIRDETPNEIGSSCYTLNIDEEKTYRIPEIGVCSTSRNEPFEAQEAELLRILPIKHLRTEVRLFEPNWKSVLNRAITEASLLETSLFLVIYLSPKYEIEITELRNFWRNERVPVKYVMVVGKNHLHDDLIFDAVVDDLKFIFPKACIGAGVNAYFAELNRNRPTTKNAGFISFAVCPQVHAVDDLTLIENLEAQKYAVESALELFPGKPVFVSPVTLKQRFNVVATDIEEPMPVAGELPPQVDARQNSEFAALWMLGSLKYLAQSGADLVTFFESAGWCGIIQGNFNPPVPEKFNAQMGDIFPVYHVLKELKGFTEIIYSNSSHPLLFDGLVVKSENKSKLFLVNFSDSDIEIQIKTLNSGRRIRLGRNEKKLQIFSL